MFFFKTVTGYNVMTLLIITNNPLHFHTHKNSIYIIILYPYSKKGRIGTERAVSNLCIDLLYWKSILRNNTKGELLGWIQTGFSWRSDPEMSTCNICDFIWPHIRTSACKGQHFCIWLRIKAFYRKSYKIQKISF